MKATISPNPATDRCRVAFDRPMTGTVVVHNMHGTILREKQVSNTSVLDLDTGNLIEMAGGDLTHNLIKGEIFSLLKQLIEANQLPFWVLDSDMKTWFPALDKFVYPNITVISKPPQFYVAPSGKVRRDAIVNPVLIVEVLSHETRDYDKGNKFDGYCTLPTFREYLLVEPEKTWAKTIFLEDPANGLQRVKTYTDRADRVHLHSIGCDLALADVYRVLEELNG